MAVVRIEVDFDVDLDGGVQSAGTARVELDDPSGDLPHLLERANGAMLRLLPPKTAPAPIEGQTILTLNNVRFTEIDQNCLFGTVRGGPGSAGTSRVEVTLPPTQQVPPADFVVEAMKEKGQCQDRCPVDAAGHPPCRCERPLGHDGSHQGDFGQCEWGDDVSVRPLKKCGHLMKFGDCDRVAGHPGPHSDAGQCPARCPEEHPVSRKGQCELQSGHDDSHWANQGNCAWANPDQERHSSAEEADCA